jgi:hypothetical protein
MVPTRVDFYCHFAILPVHYATGPRLTRCLRSAPAARADPVDAKVGRRRITYGSATTTTETRGKPFHK